jgi:hypothetical protein
MLTAVLNAMDVYMSALARNAVMRASTPPVSLGPIVKVR